MTTTILILLGVSAIANGVSIWSLYKIWKCHKCTQKAETTCVFCRS